MSSSTSSSPSSSSSSSESDHEDVKRSVDAGKSKKRKREARKKDKKKKKKKKKKRKRERERKRKHKKEKKEKKHSKKRPRHLRDLDPEGDKRDIEEWNYSNAGKSTSPKATASPRQMSMLKAKEQKEYMRRQNAILSGQQDASDFQIMMAKRKRGQMRSAIKSQKKVHAYQQKERMKIAALLKSVGVNPNTHMKKPPAQRSTADVFSASAARSKANALRQTKASF